MTVQVARELAHFAATIRSDQLPDTAIRHIQRSLLALLGLAAGGIDEPLVLDATTVFRELGGTPQASILGTTLRSSVVQAAFANSVSATVAHRLHCPRSDLVTHELPILAAALAVSEWLSVSGRQFAAAAVVGLEIASHLASAANLEVQPSASALVIPAAAATVAGRLLGLTSDQIEVALTTSIPLAVPAPNARSHAHELALGQSAHQGVLLALLARASRQTIDRPLIDDSGDRSTLAGEGIEAVNTAPDQRWLFTENDSQQRDARACLATHEPEPQSPETAPGQPPATELAVDELVRARFHDLVWPYLPRWKEARLVELVRGLMEVENIAAITELLEPAEEDSA